MTPDEAHEVLRKWAVGGGDELAARLAWITLDVDLQGSADLPEVWARLTAKPAAERAGKTPQRWMDAVGKGHAPPPDGHDEAGRGWWHPATVDAFTSGTWRPTPRQRDPEDPPPTAGVGSTRDAWAAWAGPRGVDVHGANRPEIQRRCREAGLIP